MVARWRYGDGTVIVWWSVVVRWSVVVQCQWWCGGQWWYGGGTVARGRYEMRQIVVQCQCGTNVVRMWYECGTTVVRMWYECGIITTRLWYDCDKHGHITSMVGLWTDVGTRAVRGQCEEHEMGMIWVPMFSCANSSRPSSSQRIVRHNLHPDQYFAWSSINKDGSLCGGGGGCSVLQDEPLPVCDLTRPTNKPEAIFHTKRTSPSNFLSLSTSAGCTIGGRALQISHAKVSR